MITEPLPSLIEDKLIETIGHRAGYLTDAGRTLFLDILTFLNNLVSSEGIVVPKLSSEDILKINNLKHKACLLYDNTNNTLNINLNGDFKTVLTT